MKQPEFLVRIQRPWHMDAVQLLIAQRRDRQLWVARPVELVFEHVPDGVAIPGPTLDLPGRLAQPFLAAFADMLHEERIKPTAQSFIEGELTATKKHLEDLRGLVFRPLRPGQPG